MNFTTLLFASFVTMSMISGMHFFQGYVFTEHLNIPREQQGSVAGTLTFLSEVVSILLVAPFGVLSEIQPGKFYLAVSPKTNQCN